MAESKLLEESEEEELIDFCWGIFGIDLCGIVRKDLEYLFAPSNDEENGTADSMYVDPKEQEKMSIKKKLKENATMVISNKYGKIFILYPHYNLLISFNCIQLTKSVNNAYDENENQPIRGVQPSQNMYRIFKNIKVKSIAY